MIADALLTDDLMVQVVATLGTVVVALITGWFLVRSNIHKAVGKPNGDGTAYEILAKLLVSVEEIKAAVAGHDQRIKSLEARSAPTVRRGGLLRFLGTIVAGIFATASWGRQDRGARR